MDKETATVETRGVMQEWAPMTLAYVGRLGDLMQGATGSFGDGKVGKMATP